MMHRQPEFKRSVVLCLPALIGIGLSHHVWAEKAAPPKPRVKLSAFEGIRRIDVEKRLVELDAKIVLREGDWLEQLACAPGTREHESIFVVPARPSHIHFALLAIGLEPGAPMHWHGRGREVTVTPPHGERVAIFVILERDGKQKLIPANEWIIDRRTQKPMEGNVWLFTGSKITEAPARNKPVYHADINGTTISLVNFGDDLLARPTRRTNRDDEAIWGPATDRIPKIGTPVVIRLQVAPKPSPPKEAAKATHHESTEQD